MSTNYFVSPNGSKLNTGTSPQTPFRYCQDAAPLFQPGDTLFLMEGIHEAEFKDAPVLEILRSGTADSNIVITTYKDENPIVYFDSWEGLKISGASYIQIIGLTIKGNRDSVSLNEAESQNYPNIEAIGRNWMNCYDTPNGEAEGKYNGQGILVIGPRLIWSPDSIETIPHHITIKNCEVYNCTSSGIAAQQADYVTIQNNTVHHNCNYTLFGTSAINLYQLVNSDSTSSNHNIIESNLVYENELLLNPITTNCYRYDGNGIILDDFRHEQTVNYQKNTTQYPSYTAETTVRNNIIVQNGGSGISVYKSDHISILNNTLIKNGQYLNANLNPGEIALGDYGQITLKNNILYSDTTVSETLEDNQKHTLFLYEVDGPIGTIIQESNLYWGEENSSLPLPSCMNCLDQVNPFFNSTRIESEIEPFIPTSLYVSGTGSSDPNLGSTDFFGLPIDSISPSIGAISTTGFLCGEHGFYYNESTWSDFEPYSEQSFSKSFSETVLPPISENPCRPYFKNAYPHYFDKLTVYPNLVEAGELVYFSAYTTFSLYDLNGKEVFQKSNTYYFSTIGLSSGLYIIQTPSDVFKLVIK